MPDMKRDIGLRTIFSFFLGLMLTAFVGVGTYTFHPPPDQFDRQIRDLGRQESAIRGTRPNGELSPADQTQIQEIGRHRRELLDAAMEARKPWARSTSVILIVFATLVMAISLVRADQLPVISNGLLLGGLFTMLYGVGWIVTSDTSMTRFFVITGALAITFGLGYVRFVRFGASAVVTPGAAGAEFAGMAEIERRVRDLEARMTDAARALTSRPNDAPSTSG
jgi:hypothetical protein